MNMEFLILQGNSMSLNAINYKEACMQRERREVQEDITSVTEQMQAYEDQCDYVISAMQTDENNKFQLSMSSLQSETNEYYTAQANAQSLVNSYATSLADAKQKLDKAKGTNQETEMQQEYERVKSLKEQADKALEVATSDYQVKSRQNTSKEQALNTSYQNRLKQIEQQKKQMKAVYEADMKANLKQLNKRDAQLELSINELNTMKEMYKSEKESAQQAVEQQAQDLAPKYS